MGEKISGYATEATALTSGDLIDVSKEISVSPSVYESQKANVSLLANWNIFGQDLTMSAPRLHNLSNNQLSLTNGRFLLKGSDDLSTDLLTLENLSGNDVVRFQNDGTLNTEVLLNWNLNGNGIAFDNGAIGVVGIMNVTSSAAGFPSLFGVQNFALDWLFNIAETGEVSVGGVAPINSEFFSVQVKSAFYGEDTLGTSTVLSIYDGDITPSQLWAWKANGDINMNQNSELILGNNLLTISGTRANSEETLRITKDAYEILRLEAGLNASMTINNTTGNTNSSAIILKSNDISKYQLGYNGFSEVNSFSIYNYTSANQTFLITGNDDVVLGGSGLTPSVLFTEGISLQRSTLIAKTGDSVGFYGTAPVAKQVITGVKAGDTVQNSILSALVGLGLVTDSTT